MNVIKAEGTTTTIVLSTPIIARYIKFTPVARDWLDSNAWIVREITFFNQIWLSRSLTGGIAYFNPSNPTQPSTNYSGAIVGAWPPDNEWDTYITRNTLNGQIIANSTAIWNHGTAYSYSQQSPLTGLWNNQYTATINDYVARGGIELTGPWIDLSYSTTSTNDPTASFRPVFQFKHAKQKTLWS